MLQYQRFHQYFAQTDEGLESLAGEELSGLGARRVKPGYRGLFFEADKDGLYRINHRARLISRVLAPLISFDCHSTRYLYRTARNIDWPALFSPEQTFSVAGRVSDSRVRHSRYASQVLKDAVVDSFRDALGRRPTVNPRAPEVSLVLHLANNRARIYWDTSGDSLHRRGYRVESVAAPMQETVAAAVLRLSGWDRRTPLVDPMCGSGTLLAEAHMLACGIPAGFLRKSWGFMSLPDFDPALWDEVRREGEAGIRPLAAGLITGSDFSPQAVRAARTNLNRLPGGEKIDLRMRAFAEIESLGGRIIVSNPPYGIRLGAGLDMGEFWAGLGTFLKRNCAGSTAYLYFGNREAVKLIGLRPAWKRPLRSGGLDGRLVKYEIF